MISQAPFLVVGIPLFSALIMVGVIPFTKTPNNEKTTKKLCIREEPVRGQKPKTFFPFLNVSLKMLKTSSASGTSRARSSWTWSRSWSIANENENERKRASRTSGSRRPRGGARGFRGGPERVRRRRRLRRRRQLPKNSLHSVLPQASRGRSCPRFDD